MFRPHCHGIRHALFLCLRLPFLPSFSNSGSESCPNTTTRSRRPTASPAAPIPTPTNHPSMVPGKAHVADQQAVYSPHRYFSSRSTNWDKASPSATPRNHSNTIIKRLCSSTTIPAQPTIFSSGCTSSRSLPTSWRNYRQTLKRGNVSSTRQVDY